MDLKLTFRLWIRQISRSRGLWLRATLCWVIGCLILTSDEVNSYDTRMQMRGDQKFSSQVILITLHPSDLTSNYGTRNQRFGPLQEVTDITDSFYWDPALWTDLLEKILTQNPKKIGVSLFFSENMGPVHLNKHQDQILQNPRVIWGTNNSLSERTNQPLLSNGLRSNIGSMNLLRDEDGLIRRFVPTHTEALHITEKLTDITVDSIPNRFINFRGSGRVFQEYSARDVLTDQVPKNAFLNKIIIVGADNASNSQYLTPLGVSQRHEIFAHIVDNILEHRWISRGSNSLYFIFLLVLVLLGVFVITGYPQSVAFVLILWMATLTAAISAWVFDLFYLWIPVISPAMMLAATWVTFIGYQANKIERKNWQLQQEQKYLSELEQLKNNFVSLISHDLKTPIAKIQAIVDRLLTQENTHPFTGDLKSLRSSSEELNRYIQSILKVLRVESRDFKLNKEVGDINETIERAIEQLRPLAAEKQIHLEMGLEPMFSIEVDFTLIREVMVNLIENAIKYTPTNGKIQIRSEETNDKIWVHVTDTGDGIAPEEVVNVWGKFVRGKGQDLRTKGTGLGLYLVKYFIELHGGEVFLESELKRGTTVSFSLPLEETEGNTEASPVPSPISRTEEGVFS